MKTKNSFTLFQLILLAQITALAVAFRVSLQIPMHLPGKSSFFDVAMAVIAAGIIRKWGAATFVLVAEASISLLLGLMRGMPVAAVPTGFAKGIVLDTILSTRLPGTKVGRPLLYGAAGILAGVSSSMVRTAIAYLLGFTKGMTLAFAVYALATTTIFATAGAIAGERVLAALETAGLNAYLADRK